MGVELHIRVHPEAEDYSDISDHFPFAPGQMVIGQNSELIMIDLGSANDTTLEQDWYLNGHDGVASFYVIDDEAVDEIDDPQG